MRNVTMVGNDPTMSKGGWNCGKAGQTMPVALGIPTVKVREITVGGTKA
jgi:TldD protein